MKQSLTLAFLLLAILPWGACGSTTPPATEATKATAPEPDLPPLPRSSLAAILGHRAELGLTDEQVKALVELDEQLADKQKAVTEGPARAPHADGGVAPSPQPPAANAGGRGGGRMRTFGGRGGGGGITPRSGGSRGEATSDRTAAGIQRRLDDMDTRAYLQAEDEILTPEQRDRAREFAEEYREALYDRRAKTAGDKPSND